VARGRPRSESASPAALRKREQRKAKASESVVKIEIVLRGEDAETWLEIMRDGADEMYRALVPSWTSKKDAKVLQKVTQAYIEDWCHEHRMEKAESELGAIIPRSTGQLEKEQPEELKDKGVRFKGERAKEIHPRWVGDPKDNNLFKPKGHSSPGRSLTPEEIAAYVKEHAEDLAALWEEDDDGPEDDGPEFAEDAVLGGSDDGYDEAEDFIGDDDENDGESDEGDDD
jgi:hypothetical protein